MKLTPILKLDKLLLAQGQKVIIHLDTLCKCKHDAGQHLFNECFVCNCKHFNPTLIYKGKNKKPHLLRRSDIK